MAVLSLCCQVCGLSLVMSRGPSSRVCAGFSFWWLPSLGSTGCIAHRLSTLVHRLSFPRYVGSSRPGSNPHPALAGGLSTTEHQ